MKTIYNIMSAGAFALFSVLSCQVEEISSNENTEEKMTFTFYAEGAENETKTMRQNDGSVWWDVNESIKVFCNGTSGKFTSNNQEPSATATFTGSFDSPVSEEDISNNGIMAMYPYQEDATYSDGVLKFTLPSEQVATKGTFSRELFPCVASSNGTDLSFYNVCSGIKFSVVNDDIRSVTIKTSADEPIAGTVEVGYFWDDMPNVLSVIDGVSEVTVYAPDNGYFEPGEFYYITILPPPAPTFYFWDGFTMVYNKDDVSDSITIDENVPLPRSKFGVVEGKDAGLLFIDYNKTIEFADPIMKEMCVNAFDTNEDGELSFAEARDVTGLSKMTLTQKTFKSFDEFQYFINVKTIPGYYFQNSNLESITLHEKVRAVNGSAFAGCAKLNKINLPDNITFIGFHAFDGCKSLKTINIPDGVTSIGEWCFDGCSSLTSINIPDGVTTIGDFAFSGCSSLTSINIPDGVTTIGNSAFNGCSSLTSINIPDGVTSIGEWCFYECRNLISVYVKPTLPPTLIEGYGYYCNFSGCSSELKIYVPHESLEAYKLAEGWSEYASHIVGYDYENEVIVE